MLSGVLVSIGLVLQFDAAWHSERRIGACGSAVYVENGCFTPVALGACYISRSLGCSSSGAAEYDALIFGLAYVASHVNRLHAMDSKVGDKNRMCLTVQGDCRTVIDQMRGKASPNILKARHTAASDLVQSLNESLRADDVTLVVDYALLSRDDNQAADAVAGAAIEVVQTATVQRFEDLLQSDLLHEASDSIDTPDLPTALAPALLMRLAEYARAKGDSAAMHEAARALAEHARVYKTARPLAATSVQLEVEALRLGGDVSGSKALEHQRRFVLAKEDVVAVAACVAASENAIRSPSSSTGSWSAALRAWKDAAGKRSEGHLGTSKTMRPEGLWIEP